MTTDEWLSWLVSVQQARRSVERSGALAGANAVVRSAPSKRGARPRAVPRSHASFTGTGRFAPAVVADEMAEAVGRSLSEAMRST